MKKNVIKSVVGVLVFIIVLVISDLLMNQGNSNMTIEMSEASLPVVRIVENGRKINTLHGYTKEIRGEHLKDTIFCLDESRNVSIAIEKFGARVKGASFQVRSIDGERLVEDTVLTDLKEEGGEVTAQFTIKDLIDTDTEYMLIILVTLEDGRNVRYYTRFIQGTDYHMDEMLAFTEDFHTRTFDKEAAKEITKYMESNADGDNTTYASVDIHSSFSQITWGDLKVTKETEPETSIRDLTSRFGVIELSYIVSMKDGRETDYYSVKEKYRVRFGTERMYLLDFKRDMNIIFRPQSKAYASNKISIGIADPDIELKECEGGNIFAFTQAGRLYSYNVTDNKMAMIFGYYDDKNRDVRTMYNAHDIKILSVDETGNVRFMVYGYMNRGSHEGNVGIQVYYYNSMLNTIEEEVYIPYDKSFALLKKNLEQLTYVNNVNHLFLIVDGTLYDIDLVQKSYKQLVTDLSTGSYQVSKSNRMVVWQNQKDDNACTELTLMNLNTKKQSMIDAGLGMYIKPLGFMGEDLIYGIADRRNLATDGYGGVLFPMHEVKIQGESGEVLKTYSQPDIFIVDAQITDNQINLHRVKREGAYVGDEELDESTVSENGIDEVVYSSDDYTLIADDQIVNTLVEDEGNNVIEVVATEDYEKIVQIAVKSSVAEKGMKFLTPKEVAFEGGREITLDNESSIAYYYVYGPYGLEQICESAGEAVSKANELFGMVYDDSGNYIFRKGTLQTKNQIMKIEADKVSEERNSFAVCLDTMLAVEGVTKNSAYLLEQGGTVISILEDNLEDAKVLDLTGCNLDVVLYYVNQDIPVLALDDRGEAVLIVGFNELNTVLMEPATGKLYKKGMNDSKAMFDKAGNRFITYVRKKLGNRVKNMDERIKKLAENLVNYSCKVKKGDKVYVHYTGQTTEPLARAIIKEVYRQGGLPFAHYTNPRVQREMLLNCSEEQLKLMAKLDAKEMSEMDCYIGIRGSDNTAELSDVPEDKMKLYDRLYMDPVHHKIRVPKTRWVVLRYPNASMAQLSGTSQEAFEDFYFNVCNLDYSKMAKAMESLVNLMNQTDKVRITGKGTDLIFSIKGIPAIPCAGEMNIPDGEVFTAPVKESVNGTISYNTPSIYQGFTYENVKLTFENGKIVEATANDTERINKLFDSDEGARYVGEFAIGVNPYVLKPMKDILFDEKISGSIHFTPGNCYDEAPNGNESVIHWDLVFIQREEYGGGEIYFDDRLIRKNGIFVVPELEALNPESLK